MNRLRRLGVWLGMLFLLLGVAPLAHADLSREDRSHAVKSTVLIYTLDNDQEIIATGSGSIVDQRGLVLSNFHVVGDTETEELYNEDGLVVIAVTRDPRKAAVPLFFGQVTRADPGLDLSLIRIVADAEGNELRNCQTLPFLEIGDAEVLEPGDDLALVGFPGLGGQSVTYTTGQVSGFLDEDGDDQVDWIKTDAEANPGNSGGAAVADDGTLVGVLTAGVSDSEVAGKISLVRPITRAGEILSNLTSVGVVGCGRNGGTSPAPNPSTPGGRDPSAEFLGFSLSDTDEEFVNVAPSGTEEIFANFSYRNIKADTPIRAEWSLDGEVIDDLTSEYDEWPLPPGQGIGYIANTYEDGLPEGTYGIEITVGNLDPISGEIVVGEGLVTDPGGDTDADGEVVVTGRIISADTGRPVRNALFIVLAPGITWDTFDSNDSDHIYDVAESDRQGNFQTTLPLEADTAYSVGVGADGFEPILVDDFVPSESDGFSGNILDVGDVELKSE